MAPSRSHRRRRSLGFSTYALFAGSALVFSVRFYRDYLGKGAAVSLNKKEGHRLLEDDWHEGASCANHDATPSTLSSGRHRHKKADVLHGEALLLQVSSRQFTADVLSESSELATERSASNSSPKHSSVRSPAYAGLQQPPGLSADVVITVAPLDCNSPVFAPDGVCPERCPYFAQEGGAARSCYFQCLTGDQCGTLNPEEDIADDDLMICRKCRVLGCETCAKGKEELCAVCGHGYSLSPDGICQNEMWLLWCSIFTVVGVVLVFLVAWLVRLQLLPVTNEEGLKEGHAYRSSLKLRVPRSQFGLVGADPASAARPLWPISTNLHAVQVAGPGLTLHMNFQLAIILWSSLLIVTWVIYTYCTSPDMLVLGLHPVGTPQEMCSVTLRGKEIQKRLLTTKLVYLVFMFVATFVFNIGFSAYQRYNFLKIDDGTSMTDFSAICEGLPEMSGEQRPEEEVKQCIEAATGEKVIGVSVCWDFKDKEEEVQDALEREVQLLEDPPVLPDQATLDEQNAGFLNKSCACIDTIFGFTGQIAPEVLSKKDVKEMLKDMSTTDSAFIVFETEASRDKAVEAVQNSGSRVTFRDCMIRLAKTECEPDTVNWQNFKVTNAEFYTNFVKGICVIIVALIVWCLAFYYPFANYQASYAEQGEQPSASTALVFSMVVVVGNQIMYFFSGAIAERVGFRFNDAQEALYISLYMISCSVNVAVDMAMEFSLAYASAKSSHTHTADGQLLEDLTGFQQVFESYVMQRAMGTRLFAYAFPSTFFIPFLVEPIFAIFFPYHICKLLLRTHPECRGREAEKSLNFFAPMDMGRYADLLLNLTLSVLIVFFPPGTFLKMMLALLVSHVVVYVYDQYRIMRCVPGFDYSSDYIDKQVRTLMGFPPAIVAAGIVFKGGCLPGYSICLEGQNLFLGMAAAFSLSFFVHTMFIRCFVPMIVDRWKDHKVSEDKYEEAASSMASTWFSENPVHCLRSRYVYKHDPPCLYNTRGKEHLIRKNPECGVYFENAGRVGAEEYDASCVAWGQDLKGLGEGTEGLVAYSQFATMHKAAKHYGT